MSSVIQHDYKAESFINFRNMLTYMYIYIHIYIRIPINFRIIVKVHQDI